MLFGQLTILLDSRIVIKTASHEVTPFAVIFTSPAIFVSLVDGFFLNQISMTLGLQKKSIPFFKFPKIMTQ